MPTCPDSVSTCELRYVATRINSIQGQGGRVMRLHSVQNVGPYDSEHKQKVIKSHQKNNSLTFYINFIVLLTIQFVVPNIQPSTIVVSANIFSRGILGGTPIRTISISMFPESSAAISRPSGLKPLP